MCGIAGIVSTSPAVMSAMPRMLSVQAHRGPDGSGIWYSTGNELCTVCLGHRRLSILDLSDAGAQPMTDRTGQYVVTFNGEIYNFVELRRELEHQGIVFETNCDTEVLLEAYKRWGRDCVTHFNGMFAFALFDRPKHRLFCARDRYGEKPFLFHLSTRLFVFGSEYKTVMQHEAVKTEFDEWRLIRAAHNASTGLDADRQTVFHSVQQLLPGEAMELSVSDLSSRTWTYWKVMPPGEYSKANDIEVFERFRDLLVDAVRLRLRSDVPVGSCLSGGLDSSAIVCIVRSLLGNDAQYNTFTGRFPGTLADEWEYAQQVIGATSVIGHVVEPTPEKFLAEMDQFIWFNELPVGSSSQYAQWSVFRLARERGVTVLLDGQGADEGLGGYEQYFNAYVQSLRELGDDERLTNELPLIRNRYPRALAPPARTLRDSLPFCVRHSLSNWLGIGTNLLYGMNLRVAQRVSWENKQPRLEGFHALGSALVQDSFGRYLTTLLRYGDRNSMAHSREVRLPFCDHRIAEFVFKLPPHLLMGEIQTKRLLRESLRGILPEGVRRRWNKQGFRPPQELWFRSPAFFEMVQDVLASSSFQSSEYWLTGWWKKALADCRNARPELGWLIWVPLMIELWKTHFLKPLECQKSVSW